jgi:hypothetical protein
MDSHHNFRFRFWNKQGASRGPNFLDQPGMNQNIVVGSAPSYSRILYQHISNQGRASFGLPPEGTSIKDISFEFQSVLPTSTTTAENIAVASLQSSSKPSDQDISHQTGAYHTLPIKETSIEDFGVGFQSALPVSIATTVNASLPRSKHENLDWKAQKKTIQSLYMDQDKTLTATMDIMKNSHLFFAT